MQMAEAFIDSELHCIHGTHLQHSLTWESNPRPWHC